MFKGGECIGIAKMNHCMKLARNGKGVYDRLGTVGKTIGSEIWCGGAEGCKYYLVCLVENDKETLFTVFRKGGG